MPMPRQRIKVNASRLYFENFTLVATRMAFEILSLIELKFGMHFNCSALEIFAKIDGEHLDISQ